MAEVKPSTSRGEDAVEVVGEDVCSGADGSTYPGSFPPSIAAESPSYFTWIWIQILTACSGVWGARGGGLLGSRMLGLASGVQHSLENSETEVLSRIAAPKSTWSEVPGRDIHHSVSVPCPSQLSVWEELKESAPYFFHDWFQDWELGSLIGEGGQAQIFEVKLEPLELESLDVDLVVKVFKLDVGFTLADLKRHWPHSMRKEGEDCSELRSIQERSSGFVFDDAMSNSRGYRCLILGATLLKDGRFAFLMQRYWGDLRTYIDLKVEHDTHPWEFDLLCRNRRERLLFAFEDSINIMIQIARGVRGLHAEGVLHRDLKAANVLMKVHRFEGDDLWFCEIADYECAMFVQGTGFWRAPKVLQQLQKNKKDRSGEIWTQKVNVYSFGMIYYKILTSQIPFDGYTMRKWDDVSKGDRPSLPNYVFPKLRELIEACWHTQPSQRPSFDVILEELDFLKKGHTTWN